MVWVQSYGFVANVISHQKVRSQATLSHGPHK